ncbi:hypothetical protein ACWEO1_19135 [Kitasatospora cineracea]
MGAARPRPAGADCELVALAVLGLFAVRSGARRPLPRRRHEQLLRRLAGAVAATEFDDGALKQRLDDLLTDCTGTVPPKLKTLHDALDELPDSKSSDTSEPSSWPPAHCRPATSRWSASNGT